MSIVQVGLCITFPWEITWSCLGNLGWEGREGAGQCITGHNIILKIFQVFTVFWDWEYDTFPKTSPMEMMLSKCPAKEKRGKKSKRSIKETAKDESHEARVILNPKPILKFAFCTCLKLWKVIFSMTNKTQCSARLVTIFLGCFGPFWPGDDYV